MVSEILFLGSQRRRFSTGLKLIRCWRPDQFVRTIGGRASVRLPRFRCESLSLVLGYREFLPESGALVDSFQVKICAASAYKRLFLPRIFSFELGLRGVSEAPAPATPPDLTMHLNSARSLALRPEFAPLHHAIFMQCLGGCLSICALILRSPNFFSST